MFTEVSADDQALDKAAKAVAAARADLDKEIKSLERQLDRLSGWAGGGATAFVDLRGQWQTKALQLISALDEHERDLRTSQTTYTQADEQAAAGFNRLKSRLG